MSRWPYQKIPLPEFCRAVGEMGLTAVDLLEEPEWAVAPARPRLLDAGGGSIRDGRRVRGGDVLLLPRRNFYVAIVDFVLHISGQFRMPLRAGNPLRVIVHFVVHVASRPRRLP